MMSDTITLLRAYVCENVPNLIIISMNQIDKRENRYYFMNRCLKRTRRKLKKKSHVLSRTCDYYTKRKGISEYSYHSYVNKSIVRLRWIYTFRYIAH